MKTILIIFILLYCQTSAQIQRNGSLQAHVDSLINNMSEAVGVDDYVHPGLTDLNTWGDIIDDILANNFSDAHTTAQTLDYRLIEYTDTDANPDKVYYMLHMNPGGANYWGTYIFNPSPLRAQIIIQSPHPKKDFNTGKQGYYVFRESGARVFFLSGTHRCNSSSFTTCDGTTGVCTDSTEAYRISDQAHTSSGMFQRTTERIDNNYSSSIFIQMHGFEKQIGDPSVIMSNGVQNDNPPIDYLFTLSQNLLLEDDTLDFKIAHLDLAWNRLLGTTNTQGRYINGSGDPCETSATINTGRFLHLEQVKVGLRENQTQWAKMANAIAATFIETNLPVELTNFGGRIIEDGVLLEWETATEVNNYGFEIQKSEDRIQNSEPALSGVEVWKTIGFVHGNGTTNSPKQYSFTDTDLLDADKVNYRLKQIDNDGSFTYSKTITVDLSNITSVDDGVKLEFTLEQNYPNPFNPTTRIKYQVASIGKVTLIAYNSLGQRVATLVHETKAPGNYEVHFDASCMASGMYYYILTTASFKETKKMMVIK